MTISCCYIISQWFSFIVRSRNDLPKLWNLHTFCHEQAYVVSSCKISCIFQTMRRIIMSIVHFQFNCVIVHLFQEILDCRMQSKWWWLKVSEHSIVLISCIFFAFKNFTKILSKCKSCIVATWQHHSIKKLGQSKYISFLKLGGCTVYFRCVPGDSYRCEIWVDTVPLTTF